jgi:hypothetical protein
MGELLIGKFTMQEMSKQGLEINNLGVQKTKWRSASKIVDLECVNCGTMRGWNNKVKLDG